VRGEKLRKSVVCEALQIAGVSWRKPNHHVFGVTNMD
jgi:hypothetical protein